MPEMVETTADGPRFDAVTSAGERRHHFGYVAYVLTLTIIPALFLLSAIPIARTQSFPVDSADPFLLNPDYASSLKHVNCEVVIFGDSTAETGIDPTVVARATGLKTCNISQPQSVIEIVGMAALNDYLSENSAPKLIVFQFDPETMSSEYHGFRWPEGLTVLFRQRSLAESLSFALRHPVRFYEFSIWVIQNKWIARYRPEPPAFIPMEAEFHARAGLLTLPKPPQKRCWEQAQFFPPTKSWVDGLRREYSAPATRVLVDVSPVPGCEGDAARIAAAVRGVTDNPLPVFPIAEFNDLDRHLTLQGAERLSLEIARQIEHVESETPGAHTVGPRLPDSKPEPTG